MANVLGREVSDGSHNVIYKVAEVGEVPSLTVEQVPSGENVKYKLAEVGEVPNVIVDIGGDIVCLSDPWDDAEIWDDTKYWCDNGLELVTDNGVPVLDSGDIVLD